MFNNRVKTAVVLIPVMLMGIYLLSLPGFALFIGVIALLGAWEWADLSGFSGVKARSLYTLIIAMFLVILYWGVREGWFTLPVLVLVSVVWWATSWLLVKFYPNKTQLWSAPGVRLAMGALILASMWVGFNWIRPNDDSLLLITLLMVLVWGADIGAYYTGRAFGRHKLAPDVSP
ncbi:MAG: phosphatidate cytidylyltransferase, partial [Natronospirillum sp.]